MKTLKTKEHPTSSCLLAWFVFNSRRSMFSRSTLLKKLNQGKYDEVPHEMSRLVKATVQKSGKQSIQPVIVERRKAEVLFGINNNTIKLLKRTKTGVFYSLISNCSQLFYYCLTNHKDI